MGVSKKNEIMSFVGKSVKPEAIVLWYHKVNQKKKKNPNVFFHVESRLNMHELVYAYNMKVVERLVFEKRKDVKGQRKVTV